VRAGRILGLHTRLVSQMATSDQQRRLWKNSSPMSESRVIRPERHFDGMPTIRPWTASERGNFSGNGRRLHSPAVRFSPLFPQAVPLSPAFPAFPSPSSSSRPAFPAFPSRFSRFSPRDYLPMPDRVLLGSPYSYRQPQLAPLSPRQSAPAPPWTGPGGNLETRDHFSGLILYDIDFHSCLPYTPLLLS